MRLLILAIGVLSFLDNTHGGLTNEAEEELFQDFFDWRMKRSPEFSTLIGLKDYNDVLEAFTEDRFQEDLTSCQEFLLRVEDTLAQTDDEEVLLNLQFLKKELETFIDGFDFKGFFFPVNYLEGIQVDFQKLASWTTIESLSDYQDLISRYHLFEAYAYQVVIMMRGAMEQGLVNCMASMASVVDEARAHLVDPEDTVFYEPFKNMTVGSPEMQQAIQAQARIAIELSVQYGFENLIDFLENEYLLNVRPEIAISSLPEIGEQFYKQCLKFHTSTNMTGEEIHNLGIEEVARIEKEMMNIVLEMGYSNLTLQQFSEMIRNDPANYYDTPEGLLQGFRDILENMVNPHLLELFYDIPEAELIIQGVAESAADGPAAFYIAGSLDGKRPGVFYVNTYKFRSQPRYEMVSLAMHEANPGHHFQSSYQLEADWPTFRRVMEDRIYSQSPSRFPINTAYVEGWGLYSERLGFDINAYEDPLDRFGHLSEEIFRACRLVVDTGMHAFSWTQEEAVQFMLEHTAASEEGIRAEITRYITWPGQATAYKVGQIKILELRKRAEEALGDNFDIREFHEIVLQSVGPLEILEDQVNKYISTYP